jgi:hypothetical protein
MTATISARILSLIATGMTLDVAIDVVLGKGTHAALVSDLYNALRSEG